MDTAKREEIADIIADVADGKLDEEPAVGQIVAIMEEYADEMLISRLEKGCQDAD